MRPLFIMSWSFFYASLFTSWIVLIVACLICLTRICFLLLFSRNFFFFFAWIFGLHQTSYNTAKPLICNQLLPHTSSSCSKMFVFEVQPGLTMTYITLLNIQYVSDDSAPP